MAKHKTIARGKDTKNVDAVYYDGVRRFCGIAKAEQEKKVILIYISYIFYFTNK